MTVYCLQWTEWNMERTQLLVKERKYKFAQEDGNTAAAVMALYQRLVGSAQSDGGLPHPVIYEYIPNIEGLVEKFIQYGVVHTDQRNHCTHNSHYGVVLWYIRSGMVVNKVGIKDSIIEVLGYNNLKDFFADVRREITRVTGVTDELLKMVGELRDWWQGNKVFEGYKPELLKFWEQAHGTASQVMESEPGIFSTNPFVTNPCGEIPIGGMNDNRLPPPEQPPVDIDDNPQTCLDAAREFFPLHDWRIVTDEKILRLEGRIADMYIALFGPAKRSKRVGGFSSGWTWGVGFDDEFLRINTEPDTLVSVLESIPDAVMTMGSIAKFFKERLRDDRRQT